MLGTILGDVASRRGFTWQLSLPRGGRCGRSSLPSAPSYGLWLPDMGTWLSARDCLVLSL
jgi:hypothetical protein